MPFSTKLSNAHNKSKSLAKVHRKKTPLKIYRVPLLLMQMIFEHVFYAYPKFTAYYIQ